MSLCCWLKSAYCVAAVISCVAIANLPFSKRLRRYVFGKWFVFLECWLSGRKGKSRLWSAKKTELFASVQEILLKVGGPILEIGIGPGANFKYYPDKTELIALEPEEGFRPHVENAVKRADNVTLREFVVGSASNMSAVPSESVACVVSTCVLCMLDRPEEALKEVFRILKPGGRFYFLEHVEEKESWVRFLQLLVYWPWYWVSGCHVLNKTGEAIQNAGFAEVNLQGFYSKMPFYFKVIRKFVYGWASKRLP